MRGKPDLRKDRGMQTPDNMDAALRQLIEDATTPDTGEHMPDPASGLCDVTVTNTIISEWGREGTIISVDLWGGTFMSPDGPAEIDTISITFDCAVGGPAHADAITEAKEVADVIGFVHSQQLFFDFYSQPGKLSMFTDGKWSLPLPRIGGGE